MEWFQELYSKDHINLCGFSSPEQTKKEAEFIANVLKLNSNSSLLDLCCGFGRHTYEISKIINCHIVGIDLSDDYLTIAREKYSAPNIKYLKEDMREFQLEDQFDAITNIFTSFGFFESDEQNENVIQLVNKSLRIGGLFLLDIENKFNFVLYDVLKQGNQLKRIGSHRYCLVHNEYDIINEREVFNAKIIEDDIVEFNVGYNIRLYSLPELKCIFKRNGFELVNFWGDFDKSDYSIHSRRLITLARKIKHLA